MTPVPRVTGRIGGAAQGRDARTPGVRERVLVSHGPRSYPHKGVHDRGVKGWPIPDLALPGILALRDKGVPSMSTISHPRKPACAKGQRGRRLWCTGCGTGEHLVIESVQALTPPGAGPLDAAYTRTGCGFFHTRTATVGHVAAVLNGPGQGCAVLQSGGRTFTADNR
jgi:hypothetical protein